MSEKVKNLILDPEISTCLKMLSIWYMSSTSVVRTKDRASNVQKSCSILQKSRLKNFSNIEHIRSSISQGVDIFMVKSKKWKSVILGKSWNGIMAPRVAALFLWHVIGNFLRHHLLSFTTRRALPYSIFDSEKLTPWDWCVEFLGNGVTVENNNVCSLFSFVS